MTHEQITNLVIRRWLDDHAPKLIMVQLVCLGAGVRLNDVLAIIRAYIDAQTENKTYVRHIGDQLT